MYCNLSRRVITKERESIKRLLKIESKLSMYNSKQKNEDIQNRTFEILEEHRMSIGMNSGPEQKNLNPNRQVTAGKITIDSK